MSDASHDGLEEERGGISMHKSLRVRSKSYGNNADDETVPTTPE